MNEVLSNLKTKFAVELEEQYAEVKKAIREVGLAWKRHHRCLKNNKPSSTLCPTDKVTILTNRVKSPIIDMVESCLILLELMEEELGLDEKPAYDAVRGMLTMKLVEMDVAIERYSKTIIGIPSK